jgi:AraC-like DNA-binding protein/quercetin dioxygenase-like cupin family protein
VEHTSTYIDFYLSDGSNIAVEHVNLSQSCGLHKHDYYELFFVERGSCTHEFDKKETLLIPGDSFLVPAHESHSFTLHKTASIFNCQFYPEKIENPEIDVQKFGKRLYQDDTTEHYQANINKQGIIHLEPNEMTFVLSIVKTMLDEQNRGDSYFREIKKLYLEIILINLKRVADRQFKNYLLYPKRNQSEILEILAFIEKNITEEIDFVTISRQKGYSPNHFRKIFKDFTGLSPVEYVNRLRIVKACGYLQNSDLNIGEIAESVGIYDPNYFTSRT